MMQHRWSDEMLNPIEPIAPTGFVLMAVPAIAVPQTSPLEWLYQQIYERAMQANQQTKTRELFDIMN